MVPHDMFGGNFVVLPPADVLMPHAENQGSRKQGLKAEAKVLGGVLSGMLLFTVLEFCVAIPTSILWWRQARSGVPGDVRFLAQRETVTINVLPETFADPDPGSEKLATSMERENEGNRKRE